MCRTSWMCVSVDLDACAMVDAQGLPYDTYPRLVRRDAIQRGFQGPVDRCRDWSAVPPSYQQATGVQWSLLRYQNGARIKHPGPRERREAPAGCCGSDRSGSCREAVEGVAEHCGGGQSHRFATHPREGGDWGEIAGVFLQNALIYRLKPFGPQWQRTTRSQGQIAKLHAARAAPRQPPGLCVQAPVALLALQLARARPHARGAPPTPHLARRTGNACCDRSCPLTRSACMRRSTTRPRTRGRAWSCWGPAGRRRPSSRPCLTMSSERPCDRRVCSDAAAAAMPGSTSPGLACLGQLAAGRERLHRQH